MISRKAAHRYAVALMELCIEQKLVDEVAKDMALIRQTITESRELTVFLKSPIVRKDKKRKVVEDLFFKHIHSLTKEYLSIILRKGREQYLPLISLVFVELLDEHQGLVRVNVESAFTMSKTQENALTKTISTLTGKKPILSISTKPELKGGLRFQIGDTVYDGSVEHKLEQLTDYLSAPVA